MILLRLTGELDFLEPISLSGNVNDLNPIPPKVVRRVVGLRKSTWKIISELEYVPLLILYFLFLQSIKLPN